jgi:hypothetical protein
VPGNTKTGVNKACSYDPELNPTYQEAALHYGVGTTGGKIHFGKYTCNSPRWLGVK